MRIDSIDLLRYGHFSNRALDLPSGQPDFTVIYGNNEAGKSTLLRGISSLLFGVPTKTPDVHSCKGSELRIGATISNGAGSFSFRRRKGTSGTLLSLEEAQIQDRELSPFLRELDRQHFEQFFGLDHDGLREGGEEILHGKGDVGSALFQAAGLLELRKLLERLEDEAKELFSPHSKGKKIGEAIAEYKEARAEVRRLAISGAAVKEMQAKLERARERHETLKNEVQSLQQELVKLRRIAGNKPDVAKLQELRTALLALAAVPALPAGARKQRDDASVALAGATSQAQAFSEQIAQRKQWIASLPLSTVLREHGAEIEELNAGIGDYIRGINDLPKRAKELDHDMRLAEEQWREVWRKHPITAADGLKSAYARKSEVLDLITEQAKLNSLFEQAAEQVREGKEDHERYSAELALSPEPPDPATLMATIDEAKSLGDTEGASTRLKFEIGRLIADAARESNGLSLWSGSLQELEQLKTPLPATIERYAREWESIAAEQTERRRRLAELADAEREKQSELDKHAVKVGKASESELVEARARRDRLWDLIRASAFGKTLSDEEARQQSGAAAPLPESFVQQVQLADGVADLRFTHAKDVAIHDRLTREIESSRNQRQKIEGQLSTLETEETKLRKRWSKEWNALGATPLAPPEMKQWLQSRQAIVDRLQLTRERENDLAALQGRASNAAAKIRQCLADLSLPSPGEKDSLAILIKVAEARARDVGDRRRSLEDIRRKLQLLQLEKREANLEACKNKLSEWSAQWVPAVKALLLPEISTPAQARDALEVLEKVFVHLRGAEQLRHRVVRIGENIENFQGRAAKLVADLDPALAELSPQSAVAQLHSRYVDSGKADTKRDAWEAENATDELAVTDCRTKAQAALSTLTALKQLAHCDDDQQFEETLTAAEQKSAKQSAYDRIAQGLIERNPDTRQIEEEASGFELDALKSEITFREERQKPLDDERDQAASDHGQLMQEFERLQGSEEAALQAQKAEGALAKLRPAVAQYLRLRLASEMLQRAMDSYREKHQGAVLQRASELFSRLTLGDHSGLTTSFGDDDKPVLVAVRKNKDQVEVGGLSDGTRDQLYLALRLAAIEDHVARVAPCPVILDDILINSDDARASAALEVFGDLARRTQVLLFTHHRRVADLAVKAGARIVELDAIATVLPDALDQPLFAAARRS